MFLKKNAIALFGVPTYNKLTRQKVLGERGIDSMSIDYKFSVGPWNVHEGADPFGPPCRDSIDIQTKLSAFKSIGFDGLQLHDDDVVPGIDEKSYSEIKFEVKRYKKLLDDEGLEAEFVAPRLWEAPKGIDGAYTANDPAVRQWAIERSKRSAEIGQMLGCNMMVLWLAREGTYIREAKNSIVSNRLLVEAMNQVLQSDPDVYIAIEPKPNEPVDLAYLPTMGHALAIAHQTCDPTRVGGLVESAHALLAGLDPAEEMGFALSMNKLWGVHLNDQNGLKFDQDKTFGSVNLRSAFNQVRVLEIGQYAQSGRYVGFDVKAMRTQTDGNAMQHLINSRSVFLKLVEKVRSFDSQLEASFIKERDYEKLEMAVMDHLLGG